MHKGDFLESYHVGMRGPAFSNQSSPTNGVILGRARLGGAGLRSAGGREKEETRRGGRKEA